MAPPAGLSALALGLLLVLAPPAARGFADTGYYNYYDYEEVGTAAPTASPDFGEGNIAGGDKVDFGYAYAVALVKKGATDPFCAGVLIRPDIVLTAAQCITGNHFVVVTELYDVSAERDADAQVYEVEQAVKHFAYNPDTYANDLAVIKLSRPTKAIDGGLLPTVVLSYGELEAGSELLALGWGTIAEAGPTAGVLQKGMVNLASQESCEAVYEPFGFAIDTSMVCSESVLTGQAPCTGDAGGPLIAENASGMDKLVGLYSISIGCTPETTSIYADIQSLSKWVDAIVYEITV